MADKGKKDKKKDRSKLEDLKPTRDPKGGQTSSSKPDRPTPLVSEDRGGWDGNHNATSLRVLRKARR